MMGDGRFKYPSSFLEIIAKDYLVVVMCLNIVLKQHLNGFLF